MENYMKKLGLTKEDLLGRKCYPYNFQKAFMFLKQAAASKMPVYVIGDYDVDGVCSTHILKEIAACFGIAVYRRIPKRFSEGYGLSEKIISEIPDGAYIITVDNGIAAKEAIKKAKQRGMKVMILDHHLIPEDYEEVADVVYDCHTEDGSTYHDYCGAGMAYKLAEYIWGPDHPFIRHLCVLAMIATIADSVPVLGDNRNIIKDGLRFVKKGYCPNSITLLMSQIGLDTLTVQDINYKIAPMINAPGRLHDDGAQMVSDFLACANPIQAEVMAGKIYEMNTERKTILNKVKKELEPRLERIDTSKPVCLHIDNLGEGFLGLIAGWIVETYNTAAFVTTNAEKGIYKGSARSNGSLHIKNTLEKNKTILENCGGHECAGGFSLKEENLMIFHSNLAKETCYPIDNQYILKIRQEDIVTWRKVLNVYEPFGVGFPEPVFNCDFVSEERFGKHFETNGVQLPDIIPGAKLTGVGKYKANLRLFGKDHEAFGFEKTVDYLSINAPKKVNLTGKIATNVWNGNETVKFMIDNIQKA